MNETEVITLNLSNYDTIPKTWSLGGQDLGLPVLRPAFIINPLSADPLKKVLSPGTVYYLNEQNPDPGYINYLDEKKEAEQEQNTTREEIERLNLQFLEKPLLINKITVFTNNTDQVKEIYAYYKQDATGEYAKTLLNVIQHFNPEFPQTKIIIGKKYLGEIILDGNKRLEVKVLPKTTLIIELLFEKDDEPDELSKQEEQETIDKEKDEIKKKEIETDWSAADIKAYVDAYYTSAKRVGEKSKVPPLYSLAQAALKTGFGVSKQGNNLFEVKATSTWKGQTIYLAKQECSKSTENLAQVNNMPTNKCENKEVKAFFRAYKTPYGSFLDHARLLSTSKYANAFSFTSKPYDFARKIAEARYATTDTAYENKVTTLMNRIEPYIDEIEQTLESERQYETKKKMIIAIAGGILLSVLAFALIKSKLLAKLI